MHVATAEANRTRTAVVVGRVLVLFAVIAPAYLLSTQSPLRANASGPPDAAPPSCGCHGIDAGKATVEIIGLPAAGFTAGTTYDLTVRLSDPDRTVAADAAWGFELIVAGGPKLADVNTAGGTLTVTDATNTQLSNNKYLKHTETGTYAGAKTLSADWTFKWTAPDLPEVRFWVAGNAANNDGNTTLDHIAFSSPKLSRLAPVAVVRRSWGRVKAAYR